MKTNHEIFIEALLHSCPGLFQVAQCVDDSQKKNDGRVRTFEDCRKVEDDITNRLSNALECKDSYYV